MRPDLIPRIITAVILIPLVLLSIFLLPLNLFHIFNCVIFIVAAWEWARLCGFNYRIVYSLIIFILLGVSLQLSLKILFGLACVAWIIAIIELFIYRRKPQLFHKSFGLVLGLLILPACWQGLNILCFLSPRPSYLLILFMLIWSADTVAYFAGSLWGKHKLAPTISPGKSIEGAVAALITSVVIAVIIAYWQHSSIIKWISLALLTVIASIIGDLFESMLKRQQGLKDSGKCLPGHGGILDRIDSLTAAIPIFVMGLVLSNTFF